MSTEHHIWKAISSCPIFFVKPCGNFLYWDNFLSCDSVASMTKVMVNIGKRHGQHVSAVSFNHQNDFKTFSCPMNNHRQRFWQKTTWATIMSRNDKTCIIQYFLNKKHFHLSVQCSSKSSYYSVSEFKKISDISNPMLLGHLNTWNLSRNDKSTFLNVGAVKRTFWGSKHSPNTT